MLEQYLLSIQEGYLLSDKTVSINLSRFVSKKENKLLIIGVPGSGKTSIGEYLVKKYKVPEFVSDTDWRTMRKRNHKFKADNHRRGRPCRPVL